ATPRGHSRAAPADLDAEVCALASASGPLRRALARIPGRMVAARSWERLGFARLADYAAERAGISARELRDLAHVDHALEAVPHLVAGHGLSTGQFAGVLTAEVVPVVGVDGPPLEDTHSARCAPETHAAEEAAASKQVPRYAFVRCRQPRGTVPRMPHPDAAP